MALLGPNGAGKSTLFKVIAGVLPFSSGEVNVYGSTSSRHVCIAYIPQRTQVEWHFPVSVFDVVMMGRTAKMKLSFPPGKHHQSIVWRALKWLKCRIGRQADQPAFGGQQQRMFIARALAQEAELMLMDEPLAGLDDPAQEELLLLMEKT